MCSETQNSECCEAASLNGRWGSGAARMSQNSETEARTRIGVSHVASIICKNRSQLWEMPEYKQMNRMRSRSDSSEDEAMRNEEQRWAPPLCPDEEEGGPSLGLDPLCCSSRDWWIVTTIVLKLDDLCWGWWFSFDIKVEMRWKKGRGSLPLCDLHPVSPFFKEEEQTAAAN